MQGLDRARALERWQEADSRQPGHGCGVPRKRRSKSEQYSSHGRQRGTGRKADGGHTLTKVRPKSAKFIFTSSHLVSHFPHLLPPPPEVPPGCRRASVEGLPSEEKGGLGGRHGWNPCAIARVYVPGVGGEGGGASPSVLWTHFSQFLSQCVPRTRPRA